MSVDMGGGKAFRLTRSEEDKLDIAEVEAAETIAEFSPFFPWIAHCFGGSEQNELFISRKLKGFWQLGYPPDGTFHIDGVRQPNYTLRAEQSTPFGAVPNPPAQPYNRQLVQLGKSGFLALERPS